MGSAVVGGHCSVISVERDGGGVSEEEWVVQRYLYCVLWVWAVSVIRLGAWC